MAELTLLLQRTLMDLALQPKAGEAFRKYPKKFAKAHGLDKADQEALARWQRRLLGYRDLVRGALEDPLPDGFPICHALLGQAKGASGASAWDEAVAAFLDARCLPTPYYRDVTRAFVAWLVDSCWGRKRWPFLVELAHYEQIEVEVIRALESPDPEGLQATPEPHHTLVLGDGAFHLAYSHKVHEADEDHPIPAPGETLLLVHRDPEGDFATLELTPHASALLGRALQGESLGEAAEALDLDWADAADLLTDLQAQGALKGFL